MHGVAGCIICAMMTCTLRSNLRPALRVIKLNEGALGCSRSSGCVEMLV
jgi:hypothetical protein